MVSLRFVGLPERPGQTFVVIQKFNLNFKKALPLSRSFEYIWSGRIQQVLGPGVSGPLPPRISVAGVTRKHESEPGLLEMVPPGDASHHLLLCRIMLIQKINISIHIVACH